MGETPAKSDLSKVPKASLKNSVARREHGFQKERVSVWRQERRTGQRQPGDGVSDGRMKEKQGRWKTSRGVGVTM